MARGKNSRRRASTVHGRHRRRASLDVPTSPGTHGPPVPPPAVAADGAAQTPEDIRAAIDLHWKHLSRLSPDLKSFLLRSPHELSLRKFVDFWTAPGRRENTNSNIAASICGCS